MEASAAFLLRVIVKGAGKQASRRARNADFVWNGYEPVVDDLLGTESW